MGCCLVKSVIQPTVRDVSSPWCSRTFVELREDWARQKKTIEQIVRSDGEDRQVLLVVHLFTSPAGKARETCTNDLLEEDNQARVMKSKCCQEQIQVERMWTPSCTFVEFEGGGRVDIYYYHI